ncbi:MAG: iron-containing alcohol dehydrogenase [Anaerolineaceae bacterium]|jgi:NADP-dependent alcohol dehydrogenase|nr:iron-containing alcohol dehydrogenase [Anaerolineaceae bacterium]MDD4043640.1 iron-containing alcohol dehydrogenase [Anaerolineaceae bacterium]MDD4577587.1 iron-containing alcohol dehydrogenase [Anaerolineaceae bacterium]
MKDFQFYNPTRIVFGAGSIAKVKKLIPRTARVLMLYGGGSIKKNGVYMQVADALRKHELFEFGGIEPNPDYATLMKAVKSVKKNKINFLLAVGGGSVIDGAKFIAAAAHYQGDDPWDIVSQGAAVKKALPIGVVLTLPATGSEMNHNSVISNRAKGQKASFGSEKVYPKFSILDPKVTYSLPQKQIRNGLVDAYVHILEQYLTYPVGAEVQDRQAEGLLLAIHDIAERALQTDPPDYDARANYMWVCTNALNHLIGVGVPQDWSTHGIGHSLTALYGLSHAESLAVVLPWLLWYKREQKQEKLLQFGYRVLDQKMQKYSERIDRTIEALAAFFHSLGMPTTLTAYGLDPEQVAIEVQAKLEEEGFVRGENRDITPAAAATILRLSR